MGKFYVFKFKDGKYFKDFTVDGHTSFSNDFAGATKLFDCEVPSESEVYYMAEKLNAQVLIYDYDLSSVIPLCSSVDISKMSLNCESDLYKCALNKIKSDIDQKLCRFNDQKVKVVEVINQLNKKYQFTGTYTDDDGVCYLRYCFENIQFSIMYDPRTCGYFLFGKYIIRDNDGEQFKLYDWPV